MTSFKTIQGYRNTQEAQQYVQLIEQRCTGAATLQASTPTPPKSKYAPKI